MNKCQFHNDCSGYCVMPEQIAANLCEDCQDAERMDEAVRLRTAEVVEAATELLGELDAAAHARPAGVHGAPTRSVGRVSPHHP
ncbi:hypothetical protein [Pseudomonas batumici]|uniref:Uncharacterized protein n=1 Tax=Pseudomonas batumici TaxID=226910 RepID=A0A0C2IBG1_9PSED|nr:hypothetical protein [Pseudomonas batumici]KIH84290.1 hypothetical protein UCMB321_1859 [Pseudomonas batumici]